MSAILNTLEAFKRFSQLLARRPLKIDRKISLDHLLILAWEFPPYISGGIYRPAALVRYAVKNGLRVTVVCQEVPDKVSDAGQHMLAYTGSSVEYLRIKPSVIKPSYKLFPRLDGGMMTMIDTVERVLTLSYADFPDVILASGPPFHNFVVANYLGRLTGIPYVLDYRDEWSECPFPFVDKSRYGRRCESRALSNAAKVIFTTGSQCQHQISVFDCLNELNTAVIPNGWEPQDIDTSITRNQLPNSKFYVIFVGSLGDHTLPDSFFSLVTEAIKRKPSLVSQLRLKFVGKKSPRAIKQLSEFVHPEILESVDQVSKPEALRIMTDSDALLLLNSSSFNRYIPGKLYDYLATKTPILVFGKGGEIQKLVENLNAGQIIDERDSGQLINAISTLKSWSTNSEQQKKLESWLQNHTREALAKNMISLLDEVVRTSGA